MPERTDSQEPDEILMRRFCETLDDALFHALAARYYDAARRVARERLGSDTLADDAVQETLIHLVRNRRRYDPARPFSKWFFAVLRNVCTDIYRKEARHQQALNAMAESEASWPLRKPESTPDESNALALVAELPDGEAELLRLRYLDGLSFKELGARLDCSLEAAKKRVQRLLRRLQT